MFKTLGAVIIVDDDKAVRQALKFALELEGLNVRLYESGSELLNKTDLPPRGCLVVDYAMPVMNGIDLLYRLRQGSVGLPAILITGQASNDLRERATRAGFAQVLEKPLEDSSLSDAIHRELAPFP
jgi:two-component system response regulator FixJ